MCADLYAVFVIIHWVCGTTPTAGDVAILVTVKQTLDQSVIRSTELSVVNIGSCWV